MEFKTDVLLHGGGYNPDQWLDGRIFWREMRKCWRNPAATW